MHTVHEALEIASALDRLDQLTDADLARASAIYACPPLLDLANTSARNLYLRSLLTNRDLPDSTWRAIVSQYPTETRQLLPSISSLFSATATLASCLPSYVTLSPTTGTQATPPPPPPLAHHVPLTPLLLPRLATARLLMLHAPQLTFSLFVSKHLPGLIVDHVHVELALLCVLVPDAPRDRIEAVVDVLASPKHRWSLDGVNEDVVVAAAVRELSLADVVIKMGGKVAQVVMDRLGLR
ncbi:hypothetical protein BCR44DRAFT_35642 [Catenaria anguillulae PL171]|uniref:Uncharacterized protein n=1 Tax=Catenaria anguillulae PL171 TaxID=765915 RepID=A0A1Y2HZI1_9FUNG|nr:hypothetical protein BCR44DRAFT_35642 [Catenaria anguillulae PL171]